MHKSFLLFLIVIITSITSNLYGQKESINREVRDRLIKLETKIEENQKVIDQRFESVNQRFESVNQRFDAVNQRFDIVDQRMNDLREDMRDIRTFMLWGFGILFGAIGGLITIVIWDRRTALSPVIKRNKELQEREEVIEKILKEYGKVEPKFANILRTIGFM